MPNKEIKMSDEEIRDFCRRFTGCYNCEGRKCDECLYYYLCKGAFDVMAGQCSI